MKNVFNFFVITLLVSAINISCSSNSSKDQTTTDEQSEGTTTDVQLENTITDEQSEGTTIDVQLENTTGEQSEGTTIQNQEVQLDQYGRKPGDEHYGHNHPPQTNQNNVQAQPQEGGPDNYGRKPGDEHYGHNHP